MKCLYCGAVGSRVLESRQIEGGDGIRRRRECNVCGERFTTYERPEKRQLCVVKKDGRREPFDSDKIYRGVLRACEKRPISVEDIRIFVDEVEQQLANRMESEIPSSLIGEIVMDKLKELDDVAYVRFASVYREFGDISMFMKEMENLTEKRKAPEEAEELEPELEPALKPEQNPEAASKPKPELEPELKPALKPEQEDEEDEEDEREG